MAEGMARRFDTGASRDTTEDKVDYEGHLCPLVLEEYGEYMHSCRKNEEDKLVRESDNWQLGIPVDAYMKSLWRHFMELHRIHRGWDSKTLLKRTLCAILFNTMGYLHEILKEERKEEDGSKD